MGMKNFGRDIIARSARNATVLWGHQARAGNQWCSGAKVNEPDMCGTIEYKVVRFDVAL